MKTEITAAVSVAHARGWLNPNFAYGHRTEPNPAVSAASAAACSSFVTNRHSQKICQTIQELTRTWPSATNALGILSGRPAVMPLTSTNDVPAT